MALIAVTGTNHIGKTTFINDFIKKYPQYTLAKETTLFTLDAGSPKKIKKEVKKDVSKQEEFDINIAIEQLKAFDNMKDKIIIDGCLLDNLIRVLHYKDKNSNKMTDDFVWKTVMKVKNNISKYGVIFYIPLTKKYDIKVKDKKIDMVERQELSNLFEGIIETYKTHKGSYFPLENSAAVIEILGSPEERVAMSGLYMEDIDAIPEDKKIIK